MDTLNFQPAADATVILLIRHGVTPTTGQVLPGRAPGLHLSAAGQQQAYAVAQRVRHLGLKAIYTSPMERTRETAAPTAELLDLPPTLESGLVECDFGEWTGRKLTELSALPEWRNVQETPSTFRFPGGESFPGMQARIVKALHRIAARHPGETIACFSHADPIKGAVAQLEGTELDAFQKIRIDPAAISIAQFHPGGSTDILLRNSTTGTLRRH